MVEIDPAAGLAEARVKERRIEFAAFESIENTRTDGFRERAAMYRDLTRPIHV